MQFDIFNGDITSLQTRVYARARLPAGSDANRYRLRGSIDGPFSDYAQTLPATYELRDCGSADSVFAVTTIPDPCVWTPRMPVRYRLRFELFCDAEPIETGIREFGLRDIAVQQKSILLAGQRTVLRGVGYDRACFAELSQWRELATAMLVDEPDATLCETASRKGVAIVAQLSRSEDLADRVREIAAFPSVVVVWLSCGGSGEDWHTLVPNVLIARSCPDTDDNESWGDVLVCNIANQPTPRVPRDIAKPILALRPLAERTVLADARAACDALQRDLAPEFDLAGYLV